LSKAANTYWVNGQTKAGTANRGAARGQTHFMPRWFVLLIPIALSLLIVLTLNVRAWTNAQNEFQTHEKLGAEIEQLTTENTLLQEEINRLQYDPKTIEREARKLNMGRTNDKVFVPTQ
jgi:cell division protein FtsB